MFCLGCDQKPSQQVIHRRFSEAQEEADSLTWPLTFSWIFIFNRWFLFEHRKLIHVLHFPLVFFIDAHICGEFIDLFLEQQLKLFRLLASLENCESLLLAFYAWDQVILLLFLVLASFPVLIYFPIISCAERIISRKHLAKSRDSPISSATY